MNNEVDTAVKLLRELKELKESDKSELRSDIDIIAVKSDLVGALREVGQFDEAEDLINK